MKSLIPFLPICLVSAFAAELQVGADKAHKTIAGAIAAAAAGDTILVAGGIYQESRLRVDKPLKLIGKDRPVIDARGNGEVITITAPDVEIRGFEIRNSGVSSLEDLAGIKVSETRNATISENHLRNCNFGIYLSKASNCRVIDNDVRGKPGAEEESGNGIHLWSCDTITVTGSHVCNHRDGIYLEFAKQSLIEDNAVQDNLRYGLHYMFSHDSTYRHNRFERNGAGVAVMYSRNVEMTSNLFAHNWGSASYGLLLKDMSGGRITDNHFDHNTAGIAMHGSNRMTIERNEFTENGWAIQVQTNSSDNSYKDNNFSGNSFDVASEGELDNNRFDHNYWDKYEGYDLKRDGIGDVPFRPVSLYAVVVGRVPASVLMLRSPIVHLLDQAEKAFPSITPERVLDEKPAMRRHELRPFVPQKKTKHQTP
jgi:nitrous oxidase accessory protein